MVQNLNFLSKASTRDHRTGSLYSGRISGSEGNEVGENLPVYLLAKSLLNTFLSFLTMGIGMA